MKNLITTAALTFSLASCSQFSDSTSKVDEVTKETAASVKKSTAQVEKVSSTAAPVSLPTQSYSTPAPKVEVPAKPNFVKYSNPSSLYPHLKDADSTLTQTQMEREVDLVVPAGAANIITPPSGQ